MRVVSVPSDESGCGFYRTYLPASAAGAEVSPGLEVEWDRNGNATDAWVDADVVHVHRPMNRLLVTALNVLQSKGVAVSVDIDDDLASIPKGIPSWDPAQPHNNPDENWRWFAKAARSADMVTCSTPPLLDRYAPHGRGAVVENCIPGEWLTADRVEGDPLTVGWAGSPSHHPYDLEQTGGILADVLAATGATFHTIGHADTLDRLQVDGTVEPWVDIATYPERLRQFDVGIVPLADSTFNRAKSWLKGLELAAFGIPYVASPTPEYRRLGAGLMAKKPRDWNRHLTSLLSDEERRHEVAAEGREIASGWTIGRHAHRWQEAWERAYTNRQRASRRAA